MESLLQAGADTEGLAEAGRMAASSLAGNPAQAVATLLVHLIGLHILHIELVFRHAIRLFSYAFTALFPV